ncbi:MAG: 8-oxo-dGTP diphosphatase [Nakamurella sp.]
MFRGDAETREVLLGEKLRGLGTGKIMGLGGHAEAGESDLDAAIREAHEEANVVVRPESTARAVTLTYRFPSRPAWDAKVAVFVCSSWSGKVSASNELTPIWFGLSDLPLDRMWDDEQYWLPRVLAGENLLAEFIFDESCTAVQKQSVVAGLSE